MESRAFSKKLLQEDLPVNPETNEPIILVPKEILSNLPEATCYGDIAAIADYNEELRTELNAMIGGALSTLTLPEKKRILRNTFVAHPYVLRDLLSTYANSDVHFYDF
ncbi:hypothetical protein JZU71_01245, partial [bacterium]|nr:hypothetical protein [bacterium]